MLAGWGGDASHADLAMPSDGVTARRPSARSKHASAGARRAGEGGFTLVELLVAITILGILAGVVVFASAGVGDKGRAAAVAGDEATVRTAEEAYCAKFGRYATASQLASPPDGSPGFLSSAPTLTGIVVVPAPNGGSCGGTGFVVGRSGAQQPTGGAAFSAASNTTPPFTFLQPDFQAGNGGRTVSFSFGASGLLATTVNQSSNPAVLFAAADEANLNKVIATSDPVAGGSPGTCTGTCLGIGSSKRQYTNGRLVVFSCKSGGATLAPATDAPTCRSPNGGYLSTPPTTVAEVVNLLTANPTFKLAIADPGGPNHLPTATAGPPSAPYGSAAYQALRAPVADGGGGLTDAQYTTLVNNGQIVFPANVSATQTAVAGGSTQMALLPQSFVVSPTGNDTNNWTVVAGGLHRPIRQWAAVLDKGDAAAQALAQSFISYLVSPRGQAVLAQFGYDTIS